VDFKPDNDVLAQVRRAGTGVWYYETRFLCSGWNFKLHLFYGVMVNVSRGFPFTLSDQSENELVFRRYFITIRRIHDDIINLQWRVLGEISK